MFFLTRVWLSTFLMLSLQNQLVYGLEVECCFPFSCASSLKKQWDTMDGHYGSRLDFFFPKKTLLPIS